MYVLPAKYGDYVLLQRIARGGMADVFRAQPINSHTATEPVVALKCIRPDLADDREMLEMMVDEAKIAIQLAHQNIASVFDSGKVGESFYIAMEYVHGIDLATVLVQLRRRNLLLPMPHSIQVMSLVCGALHAAHTQADERGLPLMIVHRDVSPHNILIGFDGVVKLIDFGVARATRRTTKTAVGVIKGKLTYMAPEQALGKPVDGRADLFSVGVTLYRICTGRLPYNGTTDLEIFRQLTSQDFSPARTVNPRIPKGLESIISKCLARNREDRFETARDAQLALEAALQKYFPNYNPASLKSYMNTAFGGLIQRESTAPNTPVPVKRDATRNSKVLLTEFVDESGSSDEWEALSEDPTTVVPFDVIRANARAVLLEEEAKTEDYYLGASPERWDTVVTPRPYSNLPEFQGFSPRPQAQTQRQRPRQQRRQPQQVPARQPLKMVLLIGLALIFVGSIAVGAFLLGASRGESESRSIAQPGTVGSVAAAGPLSVDVTNAVNQARSVAEAALSTASDTMANVVTITVESTPVGAEVLWGGTVVGFTPAEIVMPRGTRAEEVVVRSASGAERGLLIVPDSSQVRRIQLH